MKKKYPKNIKLFLIKRKSKDIGLLNKHKFSLIWILIPLVPTKSSNKYYLPLHSSIKPLLIYAPVTIKISKNIEINLQYAWDKASEDFTVISSILMVFNPNAN